MATNVQNIDASPATDLRAAELLHAHQNVIWRRTDRLFAGLLACEWVACILIALWRSPRTWNGAESAIHPHIWAAMILGGLIAAMPIWLAFAAPARSLTRHTVAIAQMLMSGLLIHIGDGRIEMHFHIFGSLAFLAFYRDWRVLATATLVIAGDHMARGLLAPLTIYGAISASEWRTLEHAGWVLFENVFLVSACVQAVREMRGIAMSRALLEQSYHDVELKVVERTRQLKDTQSELMGAARAAGMAEIATSVLHNVGNVLNSVNVSATVVTDKLRQSEVATLTQVSGLLTEHKPDLGTFLASDERGMQIPDFIAELATCLNEEQRGLMTEMENLSKGIGHIKHIVSAQQSMAKKTDVRTAVNPPSLFESALRLQSSSTGGTIEIERQFGSTPIVTLDEHKVMQILINLIRNANDAVVANHASTLRRITLSLSLFDTETATPMLRFSVADTGIGIAPENLARVFAHGYTTKREGHGFGLHSAANAAREMGGDLNAHSDGIGRGTTFILNIPVSLSVESTCSQ